MKTLRLCVLCLGLLAGTVTAQVLQQPYPFAITDRTKLDTGLIPIPLEPAGARGRVMLTPDGHLGFADGTRLRIAGTNLQWSALWPDSAQAIAMAQRFRALGITCVNLSTFDVTWWAGGSILADGPTTLGGGLSASQMKKLDWFLYQLRQHGVYYVFTFHSVWQPRGGDGVRQPDSLGWGSRMPLIFDPVVQQQHRGIMRLLLSHVNPHTGLAYKDDPALAYVVAAEDASLMAYWLYSGDVVRPNGTYTVNTGSQHNALIDSLWHSWLRTKGYTTDQALESAWKVTPASTENTLRNPGFEDPFSSAWQLSVNTNQGAQAILQLSDADKVEGTSAARVRIGSLDEGRIAYGIFIYQRLTQIRRMGRYSLTFYAKTTKQRGTRSIRAYAYNGTFPYDWYGLDETISISSEWKKYTLTFASRASDETSANLAFFMGSDSGDVFIDDVQFREMAIPGLAQGERLSSGTVRRSLVNDAAVSPARLRDNSWFYHEKLTAFFAGVHSFVRDSLRSSVLLCPSRRLASYWDLTAAPQYDVFGASDWRNTPASMLNESYGGTVYAAAQVRPKGKAFVMHHTSIAHPRSYATDLAMLFPAYAGVQDWDGVYFSSWSDYPVAGSDKIDSNSYWHIYDKPQILALLPVASTLIRTGAVATTAKELLIDNTREVIDQPALHVTGAFSLSMSADGRIPIFRRTAMNLPFAATESVLPHREISALSDQVDVSALDAENEQVFWNSADATFRIVSPRVVMVGGGGVGRIATLPSMIIEQTSAGSPPVVGVASLTSEPITSSPRSLLVVSTRALNTGTVFNESEGTFGTWGKAPLLMEGVGIRMSITAPLFDTLRVQPLDASGVANGSALVVEPRSGGRFTFSVQPNVSQTPWYRLEFTRASTSVEEGVAATQLRVVPQPSTDGQLHVGTTENVVALDVLDINGAVVRERMPVMSDAQSVTIGDLPSGVYIVRAHLRDASVATRTAVVIR